jgi:hypothetical protein
MTLHACMYGYMYVLERVLTGKTATQARRWACCTATCASARRPPCPLTQRIDPQSTDAHTRTHTYKYTHTCTHTHTHMYMHTHTHVHTSARTHTHTHTDADTRTYALGLIWLCREEEEAPWATTVPLDAAKVALVHTQLREVRALGMGHPWRPPGAYDASTNIDVGVCLRLPVSACLCVRYVHVRMHLCMYECMCVRDACACCVCVCGWVRGSRAQLARTLVRGAMLGRELQGEQTAIADNVHMLVRHRERERETNVHTCTNIHTCARTRS